MKRFINTKVVCQWDEGAQDYVLIEKKGYWYDGPMALAMDTPTIDQFSIQLFNDDGTDETDSTSKAGVGVDIVNQALDENILVRFLVKETAGNAASNIRPQLEIRLNGGTYQNVTGASTIGRSFDSTKLTDGDDTTQRIGSGTFVTDNNGVDDANGAAGATSFVGNDEAEYVYCFQVRSADVSAGNVEVRLDPATIDNYTDTEIKITIEAAGDIAATVPMVFGSTSADLEGTGKLDALAAMVMGAPVVNLTDASGVSPISATVPMAFAGSVVDLEGTGKLDALVAMVMGAPVVDLEGTGKLDARVAMVLGAPVVSKEGG